MPGIDSGVNLLYVAGMKRSGTLIRTTLTAAEWKRVRVIARQRDLSGSQLVAKVVRETLLAKGA